MVCEFFQIGDCKSPCISGPMRFKLLLFKGQLYYKHLYSHKYDNLDDMNQFLQKKPPKLLQLNQYEIDNLHNHI